MIAKNRKGRKEYRKYLASLVILIENFKLQEKWNTMNTTNHKGHQVVHFV